METISNLAVTTGALFVASWIVLFLLMYIVSPFFMKYGDQRSRILYSAIYSLSFALIIGIGYGLMPAISAGLGLWPALFAAFVIVLILTLFQNYVLGALVRRGLLKMQRK